jgi:1,2-diacylglycerol 3-beta-galactosyltransferase
MTKSVLVLTCDSGGGHRSVAHALTGALEHLFPGRYHFRLADIMADCFSFPLNAAGRTYGPVVNRLPRAWGLLWHFTNGRRRSPLLLKLVAPFASGRLTRVIEDSQPDVIVSTHPWANHLPAWILQRQDRTLPLVTIVTDPVSIHHWWLCPTVDLCLVPTETARGRAVAAGLPPEKVKVTGLPVGLEFNSCSVSKEETRRRLGLATDVPTILVAGGGDGMGDVLPSARAAARAIPQLQLVIVAGRNRPLKRRLEAVPWEVRTSVLGFVDNMAELMQAADLLITKAGPSTISEALTCGLPVLVSGALRGQEEGNLDWALEMGGAMRTTTPQEVTSALQALLSDGRRTLIDMADKAREAASPDAALQAATLIDEVANGRR